ncbi:hypothetical protein K2173_007638 [Erythroxylum novogranatense]|uniref:PHD finger transcription factor n=1 Tax=Erythroxylum novogranatense TaxID=1862640 RepID=A0AAV8TUB3_9ROSI|nr:hypothetical protein K2173_007638 [Erythroxylum novogranatense]
MALSLEGQGSSKKRRRKSIRRSLSVGDKVEVRSVEEGFHGSWHAGTITACSKQNWNVKYFVQYDNLLADDGSKHLEESLSVFLLWNDINVNGENGCNYRGRIRPFPPQLEFSKYNFAYGMCVDANYKDGWWEGVIFDHEEGSEERKILFPDLGDELIIHVSALRITQDWNEIEYMWKPRGMWLFLELIEKYERRNYMSVSVKQLWFDLRDRKGFQELGDWTSSLKVLWEELLLDTLNDNLLIVLNNLSRVIGLPGSMQQLKIVKPVTDPKMYTETESLETCVLVPSKNAPESNMVLKANGLTGQSIQRELNAEPVKSLWPSDISNSELQFETMYVQPQSFDLLPLNLDGGSVVNSMTNDEGISGSDCNNLTRRYSSPVCSKTPWLPAGPDLVPGPEFCPEAVVKYTQRSKGICRESLKIDVRKHLLYQKWKISFMRDKSSVRLRYTSPDGKHYFSLRQVCLALTEHDEEFLCPTFLDKEKTPQSAPGEPLTTLSAPLPDNHNHCCYRARIPSDADIHVEQPEYCPEAIVFWYNFGYEERLRSKNEKGAIRHMTSRARKHLSAVGWKFWYAKRNGRQELRYVSPRGKCYNSLRIACKDAIDQKASEDMTSCSMPKEDLAIRGQSSPPSKIDIQMSKDLCLECSFALPLRKSTELHKSRAERIVKVGKKRKGSNLFESETSSHLQNGRIQELQRGRRRRRRRSKQTSKMIIGPLNHKKFPQSTHMLRSGKRVQQIVVPNASHRCPRTVLSWLINNNILLPRAKVHYSMRKGGLPIAEGRVTLDGIKCTCCRKVYTLSGFEAHAGSKKHRPAANIFLEDGRSLLDCQKQMMSNFTIKHPKTVKGSWLQGENDYICSVCHYGGELILCDQCPSSFHKSCLGMEDIPDGDWFCPSCCCKVCGENKLKKDSKSFMDEYVLICAQCEHKYHMACTGNEGSDNRDNYRNENWFCSKKCKEIFLGLQELLGKPIAVGVDNLTWTLLKSIQDDGNNHDASDAEALTEMHSKLNVALDVMHECFEPVEEPQTGRDIVKDIIFCKGSKLNRLNFRGFYTVLLEKHDELITVATVRIYGEKVAEIPLIGTRFQYRRMGMCRMLMNVLEKKLMELGVQRLVLPAVHSVLNTWTGSFGFRKMTNCERLQFVDCTFLDFQETVMCHKQLMKSPPSESSLTRDLQPARDDGACRSRESVDMDRSSVVSEVFQVDQIEEIGIAEQGLVDISAGHGSSNNKSHQMNHTIHPANESSGSKVNVDFLIEHSDFQNRRIGDNNDTSTFDKGSSGRSNDILKCYQRRKILVCQH